MHQQRLPIEDVRPALPGSMQRVVVQSVHHWTERLLQFRVSRPADFRFRSGEFVMIGLELKPGKPLLRAYSIASPVWDEELEFFSIKVPDGPLTSKLQLIQPGDEVVLGRKPTGTLVLDALIPGKRLYLFSTGTGIAPFASLVRDPETYEKFDKVILTHSCREVAELAYGEALIAATKEDPLVGEFAAEKLVHYPSITREPHHRQGRITKLIESGQMFEELGLPAFDPAVDRIMICGSMAMLQDTKELALQAGLTEGSNAKPAEFVIEKAFVG